MHVEKDRRGFSDHAIIIAEFELVYEERQPKMSVPTEGEPWDDYKKAITATFANWELQDHNVEEFQECVSTLFTDLSHVWGSHAKASKPTRWSKPWWNNDCSDAYRNVHNGGTRKERRDLKNAVRKAKRKFLEERVHEISESNGRPWDLVDWSKPRKLSNFNCLVDNGVPITTTEQLWPKLQSQFASAEDREVDMTFIDEMEDIDQRDFLTISVKECRDALKGTSFRSASGPDHITWPVLKDVFKEPIAAAKVTRMFNACFNLGYWPNEFKESTTVIIPKPKKPDYSKIKAYRPIVLLNTLGKLGEKVLSTRMHFEGQRFGALHPNQFGGTTFHCTEDVGVCLTHHIKQGWKNKMDTSCIAFDVSQFFPSVNHDMMLRILEKQGFHPKIVNFFKCYLVGRTTHFKWGEAVSPLQEVNVGVGQGSALSPVLTNLYIAPILFKCDPIDGSAPLADKSSLFFYVDDGLLVATSPSCTENVPILREKYQVICRELERIGLRLEHDKTELMHFHQKTTTVMPGIDLGLAPFHNGRLLMPSKVWRYLGFYFTPRLRWDYHIKYYATRARSSVQAMLMLGNSIRGLTPMMKRTLYKSCVVPIMTYGFRLWWQPDGKNLLTKIKNLDKAQSSAARWILGAFRTSPVGGMEVLAGLPPMKLHLQKLFERSVVRIRTLPSHHPLKTNLPMTWTTDGELNLRPRAPMAIPKHNKSDNTSPANIIHRMVDTCSEVFRPLDDECRPGHRILDIYPNRIIFDLEHPGKKDGLAFNVWLAQRKLQIQGCVADNNAVTVFSDGSFTRVDGVRSGAAIAAYRGNNNIFEKSVACGKLTSYDAEMVGLAMAINKATSFEVAKITFFVDNESAAKAILNPTASSPSQGCSIGACRNVRRWLEEDPNRVVEIKWCPSHEGIPGNERVDILAKEASQREQPNATSYAYAKHKAMHVMKQKWQKNTVLSSYIGHNFLKFEEVIKVNHCVPIILKRDKEDDEESDAGEIDDPTGMKKASNGRPNALVARMARLILNHAPLGSYREKYFPEYERLCNYCGVFQDRKHVLFECHHYTRPPEWNDHRSLLKGKGSLKKFAEWLTDNPTAGTFIDIPDSAEEEIVGPNEFDGPLEQQPMQALIAWN
jgi:ribonuclease HI